MLQSVNGSGTQASERDAEEASTLAPPSGRLGHFLLDVVPDAPDLRDQFYRPTLQPLGRCLFPRENCCVSR